jgi:hypothetical protein
MTPAKPASAGDTVVYVDEAPKESLASISLDTYQETPSAPLTDGGISLTAAQFGHWPAVPEVLGLSSLSKKASDAADLVLVLTPAIFIGMLTSCPFPAYAFAC